MPPSSSDLSPAFELKSAELSLVSMVLLTADTHRIVADLQREAARNPAFFNNDPLLLDLGLAVGDSEGLGLDLPRLVAALRKVRLAPVAFRAGTPAQRETSQSIGLVSVDDGLSFPTPPPVVERVVETRIQEVIREVPAASTAMVLDKPLRSGQQIYARGTDLIVLAPVNPGAEVIADGHVHVYAPLRGRAIAGARGNVSARIFSLSFDAELVSIAGMYRTSEQAFPDDVRGKPACVRLEGERLIVDALTS
jgi:septum site-determining protein MinC